MNEAKWRDLRVDLDALHAAALSAADPVAGVARTLALDGDTVAVGAARFALAPESRLWLVAAGKAARGMAAAALAVLGGRVHGGVVAHPHGAPAAPGEPERLPTGVVRVAAAHPLPDAGSLAAGAAVDRLLADPRPEDLLIVLLSGGASALLESLPAGLGLAALRETTALLQRAGVDIDELNCVRRSLSRLKGGGLARRAAPARVVTLALSDVLGDRPEAIGSGPTVPTPTGPRDALALLERTGVAARVPEAVVALRAAAGDEPAPAGGPLHYVLVGSNRDAAAAVARAATARGFRAGIVTTFLQGEAREVGRAIGGCALSVAAHALPFAAPACLIFGGETTVTVRGEGRGGRNQELALGAALAIAGASRVAVFSFATDGVDGNSDAAGAVATGDTLARAAALGLSARRALAESDSAPFFAALGDAWESGPTGTNVNDLALALVYPRGRDTTLEAPAR